MAVTAKSDSTDNRSVFWNTSTEQQLQQLTTIRQELTNEEAKLRITRYGASRLITKKELGTFNYFAQFKSSIILILLFATGLSFFLHDWLK
jgi:P-type Mg2+ transporter